MHAQWEAGCVCAQNNNWAPWHGWVWRCLVTTAWELNPAQGQPWNMTFVLSSFHQGFPSWGTPHSTSTECHCQWPHQSVHHDPVAAAAREPPEWHPQGLHHQVRRHKHHAKLPVLLPSAEFHEPFGISCSLVRNGEIRGCPRWQEHAYCLYFGLSQYFICCFIVQILPCWSSCWLPVQEHHQRWCQQPAVGGSDHLDQLWDWGGSIQQCRTGCLQFQSHRMDSPGW